MGPAAVAHCYRSDGQAAISAAEPREPHSTPCDVHNGRERGKGAGLLWCAAETNTAPHQPDCDKVSLERGGLNHKRLRHARPRARADGQAAGTTKRWRPAARWVSAVGSAASEASPAFYRKRRGQSFEEN